MFLRARAVNTIVRRAQSGVSKTTKSGGHTSSGAQSVTANVTGLSKNVVKEAKGPVGPGAHADGQYKVPEYFCFDRFSYHEAEVELAKYRCPQPSALSK